MEEGPEWWAIIGPVPTPHPSGIIAVPHDQTAHLDANFALGPLVLRPGGRRLTEYIRAEPGQLAGVATFETWPVIIEGRWPGDLSARTGLTGHEANLAMVASWVHRAACLVSLAWGETWQVRSSAAMVSALAPEVPPDWPAPERTYAEPWPRPDPSPRSLPEWLRSAWDALTRDDALAASLSFFHQGLLLMPVFPSFASVAFCAVVDGIAGSEALCDRITPSQTKCTACGNVPRATQRFWATVGLVRDPTAVAELKELHDPYGRRSSTAHGRSLHGIETAYGRIHLLKYMPPAEGRSGGAEIDPTDETQAFMWRTLPELRAVADDLLNLALGVLSRS